MGHVNLYDRACTKFIPVENRARQTVVKLALPGRIKRKAYLDVIETACDRFSTLAYRMHMLVLAHAVRMMDSDRDPPAIDKPYLRAVLSLLKTEARPRTNAPSAELIETYEMLFIDHAKVDGTGLSGVIDANLDLVLTSFKNFDKLALEAHVAKYARAVYGVRRCHATGLADKACRSTPGVYLTLPRTAQGTVEQWNSRVLELHNVYMQAFPSSRGAPTSEGGNEDGSGGMTPDSVLTQKVRFHMLRAIEGANEREANRQVVREIVRGIIGQVAEDGNVETDDHEQAQDEDNDESGRQLAYKLIPILPTRRAGRQFVTLDNKAVEMLRALAKKLLLDGVADEDRRSAITDEIKADFTSLNTLFNRDGKIDGGWDWCRGKKRPLKGSKVGKHPGRWRLSPSVKTNGVELHVLFETCNTLRFGADGTSGRIKKQRGHQISTRDLDPAYDLSTVGHVELHETRVLDPGNNSPFTSAQLPPRGSELEQQGRFAHEVMSKNWYDQVSKRNKVRRRDARDRKRSTGLREAVATLSQHSIRGTRWANIQAAIRAHLEQHECLARVFSAKQRLKLLHEAKIARDRAIDLCVNFIRGDNSIKLAVLGDAGRMSGIKGTSSSVPLARIKRLAVRRSRAEGWHFRVVDESYTSKRSCCCWGYDMENIRTGHSPHITDDGRQVRRRVHGISRCTNGTCLTLWNRDKSAAINQWHIAISALLGDARPWWLYRDPAEEFARQRLQRTGENNNSAPHATALLVAELVE
jgi:hypothetical protein